MDHFSKGRWRKIDYTRGTGLLTPPGQTRLIRHNCDAPKALKLLHLVVPQGTLDFVANEVQKPGTRLRNSLGEFDCDAPAWVLPQVPCIRVTVG